MVTQIHEEYFGTLVESLVKLLDICCSKHGDDCETCPHFRECVREWDRFVGQMGPFTSEFVREFIEKQINYDFVASPSPRAS